MASPAGGSVAGAGSASALPAWSLSHARCVILPEMAAVAKFRFILVSRLDSLPVFFKSGCAVGGRVDPVR